MSQNASAPPLRLCRVVTVPLTFATLLFEQVKAIVDSGIELTLACSDGEEIGRVVASDPRLRHRMIPFTRTMSPLEDRRALTRLIGLFRRERFDIVHSSTPKAGLLAAIAARTVGVPIRIHTFTGQVWVELTGPLRWLTKSADRLIGRLASVTYADSHSQAEFLIRSNIVARDKLRVLGDGSVSGVNLERFHPQRREAIGARVREHLGIPPDAMVIGFVGRVTRDKGIAELTQAFVSLALQRRNVWLLLVGPLEEQRDSLSSAVHYCVKEHDRIIATGHCQSPEDYVAAMDLFCMPSYREGFGSVVVEAGAMGIPVVATAIPGLVDAVVDGATGALVPVKDTRALRLVLEQLLDDAPLRQRMGNTGRRRAERLFDARRVNNLVVDEYYRLVARTPTTAENHAPHR